LNTFKINSALHRTLHIITNNSEKWPFFDETKSWPFNM
jgi:hypothetical protein